MFIIENYKVGLHILAIHFTIQEFKWLYISNKAKHCSNKGLCVPYTYSTVAKHLKEDLPLAINSKNYNAIWSLVKPILN